MRLITRRAIYRAFPELDRFDDERCARFVRAAARGLWKTVRGFTAMVIAGAVIFVVAALLEVGTMKVLAKAGFEAWPGWLVVVLGVTPVAAAVFGGAWTRDLHLRWRIHRVLRARGVCTGCRYSLVGLGVGPDHRVVCPECGVDTIVDPALGELAVGEDGRARFRPSEDLLGRGPRYWTPERMRRLKRGLVRGAVITVLLTVVSALSYEVFLRWQAAVAARERPTAEQIRKFMETASGDPRGDGPDAWAVFELLEAERAAIVEATELPQDDSGLGTREMPGYYAVESADAPVYLEEDQRAFRLYQRQRETAVRLLRAYDDSGWFARLSALSGAAAHGRWSTPAVPGPVVLSVTHREFDVMRHWGAILRARMALARREGDVDRFAGSMEALFALARLANATPTTDALNFARSLESVALVRARQVVMESPDSAWLLAIENVLARRRPGFGVEPALRGDELLAVEAAAWMFEDPSRARGGRFSPESHRIAGNDRFAHRLGTYAGAKTELRRQYAALAEALAAPRLDRDGLLGVPSDSLLGQQFGPWPGEVTRARLAALDEAALRVMITLEWWKRERGRYPERLEELGPVIVRPIDPWSGGPICYVRKDAGKDRQHRGYLLYSVGADGIDNGGVEVESAYTRHQFMAVDQGRDFILNDRDRW